MKRKIKVLIVDDSPVFQEALKKGIGQDDGFEIVGLASNPYEARDMIVKEAPDVMTLDVEMPRMNGLEFLRILMPQYPIPTIVISAVNDIVFDCLEAGAIDFVKKPKNKQELQAMQSRLQSLLKVAASARVSDWRKKMTPEQIQLDKGKGQLKALSIGAASGGTAALEIFLGALPQQVPPIFVMQKMPKGFTRMYASRLARKVRHRVFEAKDGMPVVPRTIYVAPEDAHMSLIQVGNKTIIELKNQREDEPCPPSFDMLFSAVAKTYGDKSGAIILTGAGEDGLKGFKNVREFGGHTFVQDEKTSTVKDTALRAKKAGLVHESFPLDQLMKHIVEMM